MQKQNRDNITCMTNRGNFNLVKEIRGVRIVIPKSRGLFNVNARSSTAPSLPAFNLRMPSSCSDSQSPRRPQSPIRCPFSSGSKNKKSETKTQSNTHHPSDISLYSDQIIPRKDKLHRPTTTMQVSVVCTCYMTCMLRFPRLPIPTAKPPHVEQTPIRLNPCLGSRRDRFDSRTTLLVARGYYAPPLTG